MRLTDNPYKLLIAGAVICFVSLFFVWDPSQSYQTITSVIRPGTEFPSQIVPATGRTESIDGFSSTAGGPIAIFFILLYAAAGVIGMRKPLDRKWQHVALLVGLALLAFNAVVQFEFTLGHVIYVAGVAVLCTGGLRAWSVKHAMG